MTTDPAPLIRELAVQEKLRGAHTKPDPAILGPIDERITRELPGWKLDEGVAYWRWAYADHMVDQASLDMMIERHGAKGGWSGLMLGKPLTVLFYYPRFE